MAETEEPKVRRGSHLIWDRPLVDDPLLARLYSKWQEQDPDFPAMVRSRRLVHILTLLRRQSGLTQTALAAKLGSQQPAVARLERGEADPRLSTVDRYAGILGFRIALVDGDGHVVEDPFPLEVRAQVLGE